VQQDPDLSHLEGVVSDKILNAMRAASAQLTKLGIRHALVGGLAVGAYGFVRTTKDVDFLIGDEGFEHHGGGLVSMVKGFPSMVSGVGVDALSAVKDEPHLERALNEPILDGEIPVAPIEVLVYLKLKSPRPKDSLDILELIGAGMDVKHVGAYLRKNADAKIYQKFLKLLKQAP
jgi:hypothetical protein